jgi:hypothetical protein
MLQRSRDAEIREDGVVVLEQHVLRLYIPVDDPRAMRAHQGVGELVENARYLCHGEPALPLEPRPQ